MTTSSNSYLDLVGYFPQHFIMKILKHTAESREFYKKPTYIHHLDSTINILLFLLGTHLWVQCPPVNPSYFLFSFFF